VAIIQGMSGLPTLLKATGWGGAFRAVSTLDTLTRNRPAERHLYLNVLGVEPSMQRRHCGVALLDALRSQASMMTGIAGVYLETALEANVAYYTHAGYEVIGEIYPLGVRMWRMMQRRTS
jgi:ribosomal protein S18 acetylase RimI-like enzyme